MNKSFKPIFRSMKLTNSNFTTPDRSQYIVRCISSVALELTAATATMDMFMLDEGDQTLHVPEDDTVYDVGKIGMLYVVMVVCPS